jgi:peptidoglycan/xylan/chitin deacetylase (PgdA/CDA1 family)
VKRPRWGRVVSWAVAFLVVAGAIVFVRRWIHHAELELVPVIVPPATPAAALLAPPAGAIEQRMALDVQDLVHPPQRPRLAVLTFDDGPFPVMTPLLLAQLRALHVPAVFFLIGRDAQAQPAITLRAYQQGVELGDHTLTHPEMSTLDAAAQLAEIEQGAKQIERITGSRPVYFRPPHGNYDAATIDAARAAGKTMVLWDVDPGDWRSISADDIVASVRSQARSPAVILLHNGKEATIEALPRIVKDYEDAGFEFVTLSDLQRRLPLAALNDPVRISFAAERT